MLTTPPGTSEFRLYRDQAANPPALVCTVGTTELRYHLRAIEDLHAWLKERGDWLPLGGTDEQKEAPAGSAEAWGRAADSPVGGWYGLKKGLRAASACPSHRCSRCSAWPRSSTTRATTRCAPSAEPRTGGRRLQSECNRHETAQRADGEGEVGERDDDRSRERPFDPSILAPPTGD